MVNGKVQRAPRQARPIDFSAIDISVFFLPGPLSQPNSNNNDDGQHATSGFTPALSQSFGWSLVGVCGSRVQGEVSATFLMRKKLFSDALRQACFTLTGQPQIVVG